MALEWSTTAQENANSGVKILVYGESGMGKTMLCATAPKPVVISAEAGLLSLTRKNIERVFGVDTPGISYDLPVLKIRTVQDLVEAHAFCLSSPHAAQFETVCIDSISEIGETVLNNAKKSVKDPRQAYGVLIEQMEDCIRKFRDLPGKNVYMAAKAERIKDEGTGVIRWGPSMPGSKLGQALPYFFDEVLKLDTNKDSQGKDYRYFRTQPDFQNIAKDRSGALDPMEFPHLAHVFNKIRQGV